MKGKTNLEIAKSIARQSLDQVEKMDASHKEADQLRGLFHTMSAETFATLITVFTVMLSLMPSLRATFLKELRARVNEVNRQEDGMRRAEEMEAQS